MLDSDTQYHTNIAQLKQMWSDKIKDNTNYSIHTAKFLVGEKVLAVTCLKVLRGRVFPTRETRDLGGPARQAFLSATSSQVGCRLGSTEIKVGSAQPSQKFPVCIMKRGLKW